MFIPGFYVAAHYPADGPFRTIIRRGELEACALAGPQAAGWTNDRFSIGGTGRIPRQSGMMALPYIR